MKKKASDFNYEEKHEICIKTDCEDCPFNFKNNKEYANGYLGCWIDIESTHIEYVKKRVGTKFANKELEMIFANEDKEIEVEE